MNIVKAFLALCLLVSLAAGTAFAGSTGKISGVVRDSKTKEPIPGVNIVIEGTKLGAVSNVDGNYVILNVPPGRYNVGASYIGYKRYQVKDLEVSIDFTTKLDIAMEEGSVELAAVVVQAERSPLIRQDLTNPVASISGENIEALPVTEISEVIGLQAGVVVDNDGALHIRGGFGNEIAYQLNGVNINNPYGNSRSVGIATNAVQEVSVSTGTFNAEYGSALSGVVNYVTKDGGARWSGSLKYLTGDHVSSHKDLFFNINKINPNNVYRAEGSLGGPVVGDQLSFFASGVYNYYGGHLYGQRIYLPTDSYLSREGFPTGDPRKGSSTAPYYFGPAVHDTTDRVGLPGGDGAIVPLNWSRAYNVQANLSYHITPSMKLKYEFTHNFDESPDGSATYSSAFESRYKPDGRAISQGLGYFHSLELTHSVNENVFYTVKGSYIIDKGTSKAYDKADDPRYLGTFYLQYFPNTNYLTGGVDPSRFSRKTQTWAGKFDLTAQLFTNHEVKFGLEVRKHRLDVESYTLQFQDPNDPTADPNFTTMLTKGNVFEPIVPTLVGGYTAYTRKPLQLAAYIQDKIELFKSIILNLGLRYEYFSAAAQYNADISGQLSQQDSILLLKDLQYAPGKNMVSPRISVSYPITDQGTIRFSYGHFYQIGSLSSLYQNPNFRAPLGTIPRFGNPDVRPQKSIQYELGLQQGLTENLKVEITGYYKDVSDYIFNQRIITARGDKSYDLLTNLSYANTRGITISLVKRRGIDDLLAASVDYTFQVAEGNRTLPTDEIFYNQQQGRLSETYLVPMSFDRGHTLTSTVSLGKNADWQASVIGYIRTGTPYTPSFPASVVPITFTQNSDNQRIQWNVDLKLEKFFKLGPFDYSVYLQVDNLFDTENENSVYASTGRALYDITQVINPSLLSDLRNRIVRGDPGMIPLKAVDGYYADPGNISTPRLVRIGASIIF